MALVGWEVFFREYFDHWEAPPQKKDSNQTYFYAFQGATLFYRNVYFLSEPQYILTTYL